MKHEGLLVSLCSPRAKNVSYRRRREKLKHAQIEISLAVLKMGVDISQLGLSDAGCTQTDECTVYEYCSCRCKCPAC
jgi:hypothetical protein